MKVLFVDQTGQLGGGELSLLDVIRHTSHTAEIVLFSDGPFRKLLEEIPVRVHILPVGNASHVRREAGLRSLLSSVPAILRASCDLARITKGFDLIYANSQKAFLISALAKRGLPLVWHLRDMLQAEHFSSLMRRVAVYAGNRRANLIIANSCATRDSLISCGGRTEKIEVIYNGISAAPFDAITDQQILELRHSLGWDRKFVIGAFGRLTPWKGQRVLLEALNRTRQVHLVIVGDALFGENEYVESLRSYVQEHNIEQRVHFLGFRQDIPLLMRSVDAVVHTAVSPEPFGRVIVEGMLASRPVIGTRAGGALEILCEPDTGLLVSPGNVEELCAAITRLQSDSALSERLATRGRQTAVRMFSVEKMVRSIDGAISRLGSR